MPALDVTMACVPTDRSRPILDGSIAIPGMRITALPGEPEEIFRRALREEAFDITEMSMSSHITVTARGESAYVAVPVFPSRAFRHSGIFIRTDRGINVAADLKGKRIGIPEYQQTAILWLRGMLRDEHGIGVRDIEWLTGGVNEPLPGERIPITLPPGIRVASIGPQRTLDELLRTGEIDAVMSTRVPKCLDAPDGKVSRLFPDYRAVEAQYFNRTGFFPIMHTIAVRRRLAEQYPELPANLFRAFHAARDQAITELGMVNAFRVALPWPAAVLDDARAALGRDFWPYGFRRCYDELATMTRYAYEDGLTARRVAPEELFHASTLGLTAEPADTTG
jgi:4,5-dihydroxyphthalate decarboxylase